MKIERINENQIRCTLSSQDLSTRNLNLGELAYGSEKARNLFREMIQKASSEVGFEAEDIPLMVEAIPLSNESVMLVITKIEDPEELDTRFSKFSQLTEADMENMWSGLTSELLEGADTLMELLKKDFAGLPASLGEQAPKAEAESGTEGEGQEPAPDKPLPVQRRIYRFDSLDTVMDVARILAPTYPGANSLYKKPDTAQYFLVISSADTDPLTFSRVCNVLAEYGFKIRQETASEAYYQEHYDSIIRDQALQKLAQV